MSRDSYATPQRAVHFPVEGDTVEFCGATYRLGAIIGRGRSGIVFKCTDDWGNPLVAKVLLPAGRSYQEVKDAWQQEANALATLRHPGITYLHVACQYKNIFYLIMERCSATFKNFIALVAPRRESWLQPTARELLQALAFIHGNGYVHGDINPMNVFALIDKGKKLPDLETMSLEIKVGDLELCKPESELGVPGKIVMAGWLPPPEYLSPAEFGKFGKQADIYHAALLLMGVVLGQLPEFNRAEIMADKPRQMAEDLPSRYGPAIARALHSEVGKRTPSALEFWRDIVRCNRA